MKDQRSEDQGLERMVFFSDAVIAIAMTLLALELRVPQGRSNSALWHDLVRQWGDDYFPFLLSFVVIASFWISHHRFFRRVARLGPHMLRLNIVFLLMIVLLPFVTRVLGAVPSRFSIGPALYAVVVGMTCVVLGTMGLLADRHGDLQTPQPPRATWEMVTGLYSAGAIFIISIPLAFWDGRIALYSWLVLAVAWRIIGNLLMTVRNRRGRSAAGGS